jgi:hypothetical protein
VAKGFFTGAAVAVLLIDVASPAFAGEPPIGSRLGDRTESQKSKDEQKSARTAHELAGCIVVKRGSAAREFLDTRSADQLKKIEPRMNGELDCIANIEGNDLVEGVRVYYPDDIMRGDIAEELLKRNRGKVQGLPSKPIERTYTRPWYAFTGRHVSLDEMATCVADTNPAAIMTLIGAEAFSDEENVALGNLIPLMGPCLVAGTKLDAKREPLRAALAEALYQRVFHPEEAAQPAPEPAPKH